MPNALRAGVPDTWTGRSVPASITSLPSETEALAKGVGYLRPSES